MSTASKDKGTRAEAAGKGLLIKHTGLNWQRVPGSGALNKAHFLKGDLYVPDEGNLFCVEVKHYKSDHISSKLITDKTSQLSKWWEQALRQGDEVDKKPLLLFKFDRSKFFVAVEQKPSSRKYKYLYYSEEMVYIAKLEDWLLHEDIKFIKG